MQVILDIWVRGSKSDFSGQNRVKRFFRTKKLTKRKKMDKNNFQSVPNVENIASFAKIVSPL